MQRYKCNTKEKKTYLLGEHVDEEWWKVLSCQSVLWILYIYTRFLKIMWIGSWVETKHISDLIFKRILFAY